MNIGLLEGNVDKFRKVTNDSINHNNIELYVLNVALFTYILILTLRSSISRENCDSIQAKNMVSHVPCSLVNVCLKLKPLP